MQTKPRNKTAFYFIIVILPLLILILLEIFLRLVSFGVSYPLFIPSQAISGYLQPNPEIINRYFVNPENAPAIKPDTYYFKQNKSATTYRIVVQGGSTAAGFPFGRFASLAGMLQQRFKRLYPNKDIEIISTAMSAVNSYTLLDFVDEIILIKPDLVLIYAGHNEYLGIMGVGSTYASMSSRSATLIFLKLKELRLFQLMQKTYLLLTDQSKPTEQKQINKPTLMAQVAKEKNIPLNSNLYIEGVAQFSNNLQLILDRYKKNNIPVMISTLASNEKDQAPFASADEKGAQYYYDRGKIFEKEGLVEEAKQAYFAARNRDLLRFRAPQQFNIIIGEKANQHGITLIDGERKIRDDSANGIIGHQHMYEHLHPNARGYFLLAEAFVESIVSKQLISKQPTSKSSTDEDLAWTDNPISAVNQIIADFKIKTLLADYPFSSTKKVVNFADPTTFEQEMAIKQLKGDEWFSIQQKLLKYYQLNKKWRKAAKIAGLMFDALPNQHKAAYVAGQLYLKIKDNRIALYYLRKAAMLAPENVYYLMSAGQAYYLNNQIKDAISMLQQVLIINPQHPQANFQLQRLKAQL